MPESQAFALPDKLGVFKYKISAQGNKLHLMVNTQISQSIISPLYYDAIKTYFSKLVEKESEQVVLKKI